MSFSSLRNKIYDDFLSKKLDRQLNLVNLRSAFYQKKFCNLKIRGKYITDIFEELPFTTKQELLQDQNENPPFGNHCCVKQEKIKRIHKTSGTTNKPLIIALTENDIKTTVSKIP